MCQFVKAVDDHRGNGWKELLPRPSLKSWYYSLQFVKFGELCAMIMIFF